MAGIALCIVRRHHISWYLVLSDQGSLVEVRHLRTSYIIITRIISYLTQYRRQDVAVEPVAGVVAVSHASKASARSETGSATAARHRIARGALRNE